MNQIQQVNQHQTKGGEDKELQEIILYLQINIC
jgi:hypothetical protein